MTTAPINLEALKRLVPEGTFYPGDPGEGCLSVPVAGYTEVALLQDGSVWFNASSPSGNVAREERAGQVDPALPPEEAAVKFRLLVVDAVKKYLPPDEPDNVQEFLVTWEIQADGRTPHEAARHVREQYFGDIGMATTFTVMDEAGNSTVIVVSPVPEAQEPQLPEGYWHYTPEDLESDSFGPPDDPEAQSCEI